MPLGKYHPSNYDSPASSAANSPGVGHVAPPFSQSHLQIPSNKRSAPRSIHERRGSDVKRKIQQYQKDMIAQAQMKSSGALVFKEPESPKLTPLGSPGPITPFALEEGDGYLTAGAKSTVSPMTVEAEKEKQLAMVRNMVKSEQQRSQSPRTTV